jgi:hypothetical protein
MPRTSTKTLKAYETYLSHVYSEGMNERETLEFFSDITAPQEIILNHYFSRTLGKLVRSYQLENFLDGYAAWVMDS